MDELIVLKVFFCIILPLCGYAEDKLNSYSYYKGVDIYETLIKTSDISLNFDDILAGINDAHQKKNIELTEEEYLKLQEILFTSLQKEKKLELEQFLEKLVTQKDVISIVKDKLFYKIEKKGAGESIGDYPVMIFKISELIHGSPQQFYESAKPKPLYIKSMIEGFSKGVKGMIEGEKRTLYIHPDLAYGNAGSMFPTGLIIIEVEVVEANSPQVNL